MSDHESLYVESDSDSESTPGERKPIRRGKRTRQPTVFYSPSAYQPDASAAVPWPNKYAHIEGDQTIISQLTPVLSYGSYQPGELTQEMRNAQATNESIENAQRKLLHGFTTRELTELDAITTRDLRGGDLANVLHPLFRRERWEYQPDPLGTMERKDYYTFYDIPEKPDGLEGNWAVSNEAVWEVMGPSLRIATYLLASMHMMPFIKILFFGSLSDVDESRRPTGYKGKLVQVTRANDNNLDMNDLSAHTTIRFDEMVDKFDITFGFQDKNENPYDRTKSDVFMWGLTGMTGGGPSGEPLKIRIFLSWSMVLPLFREDLHDSERMGLQWYIANVLCHELLHAMWYTEDLEKHGRQRLYDVPEPYVEEDPVTELGFAFETSTFGGTSYPFREYADTYELSGLTTPLGFWLQTEWPTPNHGRMSNEPILTKPPMKWSEIWRPIPVTFYEDVQQREFWDTGVAKFGTSVLQGRAKRLVSRVNLYEKDSKDGKITMRENFEGPQSLEDTPDYYARIRELRIRDAVFLSPEERELKSFGERLWSLDEFQNNHTTYSAEMREKGRTMNTWLEDYRVRRESGEVYDTEAYQGVKLLDEARKFHLLVVKNMCNYEQATGSYSIDAHQSLLTWNWAARKTAYRLRDIIHGDPGYSPDHKLGVDYLLQSLEWCTSMLWAPEDMQNPDAWTKLAEWVPDFIDSIKVLQQVVVEKNDHGACRASKLPSVSDAMAILAPLSHYPKLITSCLTVCVPFWNPPNITQQEHIVNLHATLIQLRLFRDGFNVADLNKDEFGEMVHCPRKWRRSVDEWTGNAEFMANSMARDEVERNRLRQIGPRYVVDREGRRRKGDTRGMKVFICREDDY
ncbi:hypothetical protein HYALB_00006416 [Hymenoscyphus albidus]|uniref:Uncharacterized protein n=1 Tax=Hymenoscyphus albidus TaxID=595503 RepID=A0A9N9LLD2_9HELO|nr:hypothetical protein HYALB_00006416 [Hymenoscyphus albidus]